MLVIRFLPLVVRVRSACFRSLRLCRCFPKPALDRRRLRVVSVALLVVLLLSTSATAYGGLLVFRGVARRSALEPADRHSIGGDGVRYATVPRRSPRRYDRCGFGPERRCATGTQIAKRQFKAGSGTLRLRYIRMAFDLFPQRPLFGSGVGSYYGASVLGTLLAETGLLGLAAFVLAHRSAYLKCLRVGYDTTAEVGSLSIALVVSSATLLGSHCSPSPSRR